MDENGVVIIEGFLTEGEADELREAGVELEKQRPENEKSIFLSTTENGINESSVKIKDQVNDFFYCHFLIYKFDCSHNIHS